MLAVVSGCGASPHNCAVPHVLLTVSCLPTFPSLSVLCVSCAVLCRAAVMQEG